MDKKINLYTFEQDKVRFSNKNKYYKIKDDYKEYYRQDLKIFNAIMDLNKLYYKLAKNYFIIEVQIDEKEEDFFNL